MKKCTVRECRVFAAFAAGAFATKDGKDENDPKDAPSLPWRSVLFCEGYAGIATHRV